MANAKQNCWYEARQKTYNTADEGQVLGHHVFEVVRDEYAAHVHLNVVDAFAIVLEHVDRSSLRHKENRLKCHFTLSGKVRLGHRLLAVLRETLVELVVFVVAHFRRPTTTQRTSCNNQ